MKTGTQALPSAAEHSELLLKSMWTRARPDIRVKQVGESKAGHGRESKATYSDF